MTFEKSTYERNSSEKCHSRAKFHFQREWSKLDDILYLPIVISNILNIKLKSKYYKYIKIYLVFTVKKIEQRSKTA